MTPDQIVAWVILGGLVIGPIVALVAVGLIADKLEGK